jgi:hypothetical protein
MNKRGILHIGSFVVLPACIPEELDLRDISFWTPSTRTGHALLLLVFSLLDHYVHPSIRLRPWTFLDVWRKIPQKDRTTRLGGLIFS